MTDKTLTTSLPVMTAVRSIRALSRAEAQYANQGYDPVEAAHLIYDRAISYYDSVFPADEVNFRQMLLNRREKVLAKAMRSRASGRG